MEASTGESSPFLGLAALRVGAGALGKEEILITTPLVLFLLTPAFSHSSVGTPGHHLFSYKGKNRFVVSSLCA